MGEGLTMTMHWILANLAGAGVAASARVESWPSKRSCIWCISILKKRRKMLAEWAWFSLALHLVSLFMAIQWEYNMGVKCHRLCCWQANYTSTLHQCKGQPKVQGSGELGPISRKAFWQVTANRELSSSLLRKGVEAPLCGTFKGRLENPWRTHTQEQACTSERGYFTYF